MEPTKPNESGSQRIFLDFRFQKTGKLKRYKIKKQQKLERAMTLWCKEMEFPREKICFFWKKQQLHGHDIAEFCANDIINVVFKDSLEEKTEPEVEEKSVLEMKDDDKENESNLRPFQNFNPQNESNVEEILSQKNGHDMNKQSVTNIEPEQMELGQKTNSNENGQDHTAVDTCDEERPKNPPAESNSDKLRRLKPSVDLFFSYVREISSSKLDQYQMVSAKENLKTTEHANELNALRAQLDKTSADMKMIQEQRDEIKKEIESRKIEEQKLKEKYDSLVEKLETTKKLHAEEMNRQNKEQNELDRKLADLQKKFDEQPSSIITTSLRKCVNCGGRSRLKRTLPYCTQQCIDNYLKRQ